LVDFVEVDAERCTRVRGLFLGDVSDDCLDVFIFPHVRFALCSFLFEALEDSVWNGAVSAWWGSTFV
jgi:hypothetical protein